MMRFFMVVASRLRYPATTIRSNRSDRGCQVQRLTIMASRLPKCSPATTTIFIKLIRFCLARRM